MRLGSTARRLSLFIIATALLPLFSPTAQAGEAYYLLMFGAQRTPNVNPNYTHSFAVFVRACWPGDGPCPTNPAIEHHIISWLPCTMVVRVGALCPEEGRNFDLHTTIRWVLDNDMRLSMWGAYEIEPELYYMAMRQIDLLESGTVRYKAADMGRRSDRVSNCIHAMSSVVEGPRLRVASPGWGEPASYFVLQKYEPWIIGVGCTHPWVGSALGLDQYPIIYRDYARPCSGAFLGTVNRLLGGERDLVATYGPPAP